MGIAKNNPEGYIFLILRGGPMNLREYINTLNPEAFVAYAERCGIAVSYLRVHVKYASKDPSVSLIKSLARESEQNVSITEVLKHFGVIEEEVSKAA